MQKNRRNSSNIGGVVSRLKRHTVKLIIFLVCLALFASLSAAVKNYLRASELFLVREVQLSGNEELTKEKLAELCSLKLPLNIFEIDSGLLKLFRQRLEANPLVKRAEVKRLFPHTLSIVITERKPFAQLKKGPYFIIDKEAVAIPPTARTSFADIPLIVATDLKPVVVGKRCVSAQLDLSLQFLKLLVEEGFLERYTVTKIQARGSKNIFLLIDQSPEVRFRWEDVEELKEKIGWLEEILEEIKGERKKVKYIDLRFKQPVIGRK
jgi:cell division septal protein FtsQ